ncbi:DNA polymerase I [Cryobacterium sp. TMT2-18-3]|uniref:DNA polymerase I n=1 Tax=unclassified Cryobacterium TaxID=2649013 RepID=UPI00106B8568|nr:MULTISPECIES: DNA polymerase I [unclassified Cryobacterium]TFC29261.1 DNA polymerase I [Cryobacterium sp. TMT2-18-2]TFC61489.1 DNA polymerase I [Cryobacterium sp. TMT2-18-3]
MSDSEKPTLMIIDGHSLAYRAFHALPVDSFQTHDGQHTNAIHGFLSMLLSLLRNEKPTHIAVAFDISRFSFRTREYADYKGTRASTPSEFIGQVPLLQEALAAMNITTLTKEDFEADDILATLSVRGNQEGFHVLVVSGDRDTIQLVNENVTLLYPASQGVSALTRYDPARVREKYGIEPAQYPDVAALVGETSDNLIGISKVGEKTAVKWLGLYGSLAGILDHAEEIKGVVGNNLREQKENAIRNRRLNHLVTDLDLPVELPDLVRCPIDEPAVRAVFGRLEFRTLLDRVIKLEGAGATEGVAVVVPEEVLVAAPQAPAAQDLLDEELAAWIARAAVASPQGLALSVEVHEGKAIGFGVSGPTESVNLPWQPGRADYLAFEAWLASDSPKIMHDAKSQIKALRRSNLDFSGLVFDSLIAGWLLRPGVPDKTLATLVLRYLGETVPLTDPNQLIPAENEAGGVPVESWYTFRVAAAIDALLDDGSREVLTTIEMPTLLALSDMELAGVAVSHDQLSALSGQLGERAAGLAAGAYAEIGREVNLGSPKQLQEVLFDQLGMPKTRANKTGFSTDAGALADLQTSNPHPFLDMLLQHRDATKLRQIVETLDKAIDETGRIHTTYVQIGTATGRISSTDPNLQNIPVRTEEGRRIRAAFHAANGAECLLTADYSQIEMRIMAHLSGDAGLIEAFNAGEDLHRFVGASVFGVAPEDVTNEMRSKVKAMSYGLAYGLSAFGLSRQLRIETKEAKQLITDYFARFGAVRDYLRNVVEQAKMDGYTATIFGRRRPFPELHSANRVVRENAERAALNAPIQGSAADIMKIAMNGIAVDLVDRNLESRMLLQVHDELIFEVAPGEWDALRQIVTHRMETAADLLVPLDVQVGRGDNWDAAAH